MKKIVECINIYKNYYQGKIEIPVLKDINFVMNEGDYRPFRVRQIDADEPDRMP